MPMFRPAVYGLIVSTALLIAAPDRLDRRAVTGKVDFVGSDGRISGADVELVAKDDQFLAQHVESAGIDGRG